MKKTTLNKLSLILVAALASVCLFGCGDKGGKEFHTLYEDTMPSPNETVYVTVPVEIIVTVPVEVTKESNPDDTAAVTGGADTDVATEPEETAPQFEIDLDSTVEGREVVYAENGALKSTLSMKYLKISGLENTKIEEKVNTLLSDICEAKCNSQMALLGVDDLMKDGISVELKVTSTEITYASTGILSVKTVGEISRSDGTLSKFFFSNVINLSTGKEIAPKNIFKLDAANDIYGFASVLDLFKNGKFTALHNNPDLEQNVSLADMAEQYKDYLLYSTQYPSVYFTKNTLVICVSVSDAFGSYAEYSIPLSQVTGYLKISP